MTIRSPRRNRAAGSALTSLTSLTPPALIASLALAGCAANDPPMPSPDQIASICLKQAAQGGDPVSLAHLSALQWQRYVGCRIGGSLYVARPAVDGYPEAVLSTRFSRSGAVESSELQPANGGGDPAWNAAVTQALASASPLPALGTPNQTERIDLHFSPRWKLAGLTGGAGLSSSSHWSVEHCTVMAAGAKSCTGPTD
ncbi:TonB C-terminal domain-containing protein [Burkholderia gladioli]|uniref:TonB C-terminal domain-containing protein n=1 Tax=Burkholderia gladioli TaxID=28095 RepID=UPI000649B169